MGVLLRSWNVFHGRTFPPGRTAYLHEAVSLAVEGAPDVVCLQEVPLWGVDLLAAWSGMAVVAAKTRRAMPLPFGGARRVTDLDHGRLRSLLTGQANAVLVGARYEVVAHDRLMLNDRAFRRWFAAEQGLEGGLMRVWAKEPRVSQAVRLVGDGVPDVVVVNIHASHIASDGRLGDAEILRAVAQGEELAELGDAVVAAGDFNARRGRSAAIDELEQRGYSPAGPGIDHVMARGVDASTLVVWPEERRRLDGRLLSDHPPVELVLG